MRGECDQCPLSPLSLSQLPAGSWENCWTVFTSELLPGQPFQATQGLDNLSLDPGASCRARAREGLPLAPAVGLGPNLPDLPSPHQLQLLCLSPVLSAF